MSSDPSSDQQFWPSCFSWKRRLFTITTQSVIMRKEPSECHVISKFLRLKMKVFYGLFAIVLIALMARKQYFTPTIKWVSLPLTVEGESQKLVDSHAGVIVTPSIEYSLRVDGLALPIDPLLLDGGSRLYPAIDAFGSVYFRTTVVVEKSLIIGGIHIQTIVENIRAMNIPTCAPCHVGIRRYPECECTCQPGYTGVHCNISIVAPMEPPVTPSDVYIPECATTTINNSACPSRLNWGHDSDYVCGGGYEFGATKTVALSYMKCETQGCYEHWLRESPVCCAPGVRCARPRCDSLECCKMKITKYACLDVGCSWCSDFCAHEAPHCETPFAIPNIEGEWNTVILNCPSDDVSTICDLATRTEYLDLYSKYPTLYSDYLTIRDVVNSKEWPRLAVSSSYNPGVAHWLTTTGSASSTCRTYLGRLKNGLAVWSCTPQAIYIRDSVIWNTFDECLDWSSDPLWWQTAVQQLGTFVNSNDGGTNEINLNITTLFDGMLWRPRMTCPEFNLTLAIADNSVVTPDGLKENYLAPVGTHIPIIPDVCSSCKSLGNCSVVDVKCIQNRYSLDPWDVCCGCLWKHTTFRASC